MKYNNIKIAYIPSDYNEIDIMLERDIFAAIALLGFIFTSCYCIGTYLFKMFIGG